MARDFYKKDGSYYYSDNNQKILNVQELQAAARVGGKEISVPITSSQGLGDNEIKQLYKKYGLPEPDVSWVRKNLPTTTQQLEQVLKTQVQTIQRQSPSSTTSNNKEQQQQALSNQLQKQAEEYIQNSGLSTEEQAILQQIATGDYTNQAVPTDAQMNQLLQDAATLAEQSLNPYYEKITGQTIEDLKRNMESIRSQASNYLQQEQVDYKKQVQQTKDSLRQRGLTFSGVGRRQLGNEGFINAQGVQGELPTQRISNIQSGLLPYQQQATDLSIQGQRALGSSIYNNAGLNLGDIQTGIGNRSLITSGPTTPITTGDIELERLKAIQEAAAKNAERLRLNL